MPDNRELVSHSDVEDVEDTVDTDRSRDGQAEAAKVGERKGGGVADSERLAAARSVAFSFR